MKIYAETKRLILREIVAEDRIAMFAMDSDQEVHKYLGNEPVQNIKQIDEVIAFIRKQYIDNGIGRWAMVEKTTNIFIGWSGLKFVEEETNKHIDYYDLGYDANKNYWDKGYATEAAKASLHYGFNNLNLNKIYAMTDSQNMASRNVIEKVGLKYMNTFEFDNTNHDWFEISRS